MTIKLFNTLTKKKEVFQPIDPKNVRIYVCGPTVYSRPHIGNFRSVVVYDLWFRLFLKTFPKVVYVRNITDVDDKINLAAISQNITIQQLTSEVLNLFYQDCTALNVLSPTFEPKATEHIAEMIIMIENLIKNGHAYLSQNHILFSVKSCPDYGQLSKQDVDDMIIGSRVEVADYKKDPLDFVLWKPADENDDISSIFSSPWGKGRPGWHIECSAMSNKYLGSNFDIHGGGSDLQFPHHENEIAQSKCANIGSFYAKYWVHNGFLTLDGEKMSKSLNNFLTIKDLLDKSTSSIAIRYLLLATHYRKPLDFNKKALFDAEKAIEKFYNLIKFLPNLATLKQDLEKDLQSNPYFTKIIEALSDDLNTPLAFSVLHQVATAIKQEPTNLTLTFYLLQCLNFIGLFDYNYFSKLPINNSLDKIDENFILTKISARKAAKALKNWAEADLIRKELLEYGIILKDLPNGEVEYSQNNKQ